MLHLWRKPGAMPQERVTGCERFRINHVTAGQIATSMNDASLLDAATVALMEEALEEATERFVTTMTFEQYLVHNATHWELLHSSLRRLQRDASAPSHLAYPFADLHKELSDLPSKDGRIFSLNEMELSLGILTTPAITTLTFYEGTAPLTAVRARLVDVVMANPWLAGRLVSGENGEVNLRVPLPNNAKVTIAEVQAPSLSAAMPDAASAIELCKGVGGVKIGLSCIDNDEPLFAVTVLLTGGDSFALLVSLSHAIGDAATFYRVYGMLNPSGMEPMRLKPDRLQAFNEASVVASFGPTAGSFNSMRSTKPKMIGDALSLHESKDQTTASKRVSLFAVDDAWISRTKGACAEEARESGFHFE